MVIEMEKIRVVFMGTPKIAVPVLEMLIKKCHVVLVVTKPDSLVGRKKVYQESPVKQKAKAYNIEVFQPLKLKDNFAKIEMLKPDLIITCAFGKIISPQILKIPRLGAINIHASLLPKYRGASPIRSVLLNGEDVTGITLMYMDEGIDTGDIIAQSKLPINLDDNYETIYNKLALLGRDLLLAYLPKIINNTIKRQKQDYKLASYTKMITREDEKLDFTKDYHQVYNKIRAFSPQPLAYFNLNGNEIKVIKATLEENKDANPGYIKEITKHTFGIDAKGGTIYLELIKPVGKKEMTITSFINGLDINNLKGKKVN